MRRGYVLLAALATAIALAFLFAILLVGYRGRVEVRSNQIAGCERGKQDRAVNARSWEVQAAADQAVADDPTQSALTRAARSNAAAQHRITVRSLRQRSRIDCAAAFSKPSLLR